MGYKVKTLTGTDFEKHCMILEEIIAGDFRPDLVIGIRTGGLIVSEIIFKDCKHDEVYLQRPTTAGKNKMMHRLLKGLPYAILDKLRIVESIVLDKLSSHKPRTDKFNIPDATQNASKILIVDDAVDSGATLEAVVRAIKSSAPDDADIRTAVITVTTKSPIIRPDYYIYNDNTLIRFPWSMDFKI